MVFIDFFDCHIDFLVFFDLSMVLGRRFRDAVCAYKRAEQQYPILTCNAVVSVGRIQGG